MVLPWHGLKVMQLMEFQIVLFLKKKGSFLTLICYEFTKKNSWSKCCSVQCRFCLQIMAVHGKLSVYEYCKKCCLDRKITSEHSLHSFQSTLSLQSCTRTMDIFFTFGCHDFWHHTILRHIRYPSYGLHRLPRYMWHTGSYVKKSSTNFLDIF